MQRASQVFIPLTGRCFLSKRNITRSAHGPIREYTWINRSAAIAKQTQSASHSPLIDSSLQQQLSCSERFSMNDYYRERFERSQTLSSEKSVSSNRSSRQHYHNVPFRVGDIVIHLVPRLMNNAYHENNAHNRSLSSAQHVRSSTANMYNSSESFSDRLMREMHMLDGREVAELNQGLVSVGKVVVFAVCNNSKNSKSHCKENAQMWSHEQKRPNVIAPHHVESHLSIVENAAPLLCERRILEYRSEYEAMQLVEMVSHHFDRLYAHNVLRLKISQDGSSSNNNSYDNDVSTLRFVIVHKHAPNSAL